MFKYKPGDKVISLRTYNRQFTRGKIYTIANRGVGEEYIAFEQDDLGSVTNSWVKYYFVPYSKLALLLNGV